ncbi:hypothetical protein IMZ48_11115 [Candidatus Bathyarchaeota archaeon]|nr:hypothetical protein [Candidatus Bathyarchaeota archaeon]
MDTDKGAQYLIFHGAGYRLSDTEDLTDVQGLKGVANMTYEFRESCREAISAGSGFTVSMNHSTNKVLTNEPNWNPGAISDFSS